MLVAAAKEEKKKRIQWKKIFQRLTSNSWVTYIFFLYIIAFLVFGYTLIQNRLVIPISGDFVIQDIPFYFNGYDDWMTAITTGKFPLWDDSAFLGVNNIGANAFYYLFNIFFLPILLIPRQIIPQVQAFFIITKIVLAGVGMRKLLEIFDVKNDTAILVGTAYAFCGWNFFYLWFNHFFEIAVLMPFFLLSIEILLRKRNPLPLIFMVCLVGLTNYFFLISFCFTGVLYSVFRYFQRFEIMGKMNESAKYEKHHFIHVRIEIILKGIMGFALGLLLAGAILLPCFEAVLTNSRVTEATYGSELLEAYSQLKETIQLKKSFFEIQQAVGTLFGKLTNWEMAEGSADYQTKYLLYPAISFFFPTISCYDSPLFINIGYDNHQASLYVYTPLTLLLLPSILLSLKQKKFSHIFAVLLCLGLIFTPFAYYCFSGFTTNAYGRWQIFIVAIYCVYVAIQLDHRQEFVKGSMLFSVILTVGMQYFLIDKAKGMAGTVGTRDLDQDRLYFCYGVMIWTILVYIYYLWGLKKKDFISNLKYLLAIEVIVVGNIVQQVQGTTNFNNSLYGGYDNIAEEVYLANRIKEVDKGYYRVFSTSADRTGNNLGMILGTRGVGTFHSVYNYNLDSFLNWSQVTYGYGGWSMGIHEKRVNLDTFLGIKYYIVKSTDQNVPFGFEEIYSTDNHSVYVNTNYVDLGFSFDTIYDESSIFSETYAFTRSYSQTFVNELAYLNGAIIEDETGKQLIADYPNLKSMIFDTDPAVSQKYSKISSGRITVQRQENGQLQDEEVLGSNMNLIKGLKWGSIVEETFPTMKVCDKASKNNPCFIDLQARMGENLMISLYGGTDGNKLLVQDNHMTHGYSKEGDIKTNRGFYVSEEVTKIRIEVRDNFGTNTYLVLPDLYYEYYDSYLENIDKLKETAVKNVNVISADEYTFETDYEAPRIVVLNIPFDNGWHLIQEDTKEEIPLYKVDGGFNGFISEQGNHSYRFYYETPNLRIGLKITYIGMILTLLYYGFSELLKQRNEVSKLCTLYEKKKNNPEDTHFDAIIYLQPEEKNKEITIRKKD